MRRSISSGFAIWAAILGALALGGAAARSAPPARPAAPTVTGPRETTSTRPVYRFHARGAVSFRCAFDSTTLHACSARYSEPLTVGRHVLRVRSVGRSRATSRVVTVAVRVLESFPELQVGPAVAVGPGAGVPAAVGDSVWVPTTVDGALARVVGGAVTSRTPFGKPPPAEGYLDAAVAADGVVWAASDAAARIVRVDPASAAVTARLDVPDRPGGLAAGGGAVWAFHLFQGAITRIDTAAATGSRLNVPGASASGIAYGAGSLWLLSAAPAQVYQLDPLTGAVQRTIPLRPPFPVQRSFIETWWLAFGDGALWATLPNHDAVVRVDASSGEVRYVRLRDGTPFGIATGGGSAWVATNRAVVRLDGGTGAVLGVSSLPLAERTGFVSIAYADGAAWLTNFDRGTLVRVVAAP